MLLAFIFFLFIISFLKLKVMFILMGGCRIWAVSFNWAAELHVVCSSLSRRWKIKPTYLVNSVTTIILLYIIIHQLANVNWLINQFDMFLFKNYSIFIPSLLKLYAYKYIHLLNYHAISYHLSLYFPNS